MDWLDAAVELMGRSGRSGSVRVQGGSMQPMLRPGQLLAVEFAPTRLRAGDLLLFRQADYLVVHRLLGRGPGGCLLTRGDAVPRLDPALEPQRVVGRVVAVEQAAGEWVHLRGAAGRAYARLVAWHDRGWALAHACGRVADGALRRVGLGGPFERCAAAADRLLLRLAHRSTFRLLHRPMAPPPHLRDSETEGARR